VARRPDAVTIIDRRLRVVPGDVPGPASPLRDGAIGADAVLSTLGGRAISRPTTVYSTVISCMLCCTGRPESPTHHRRSGSMVFCPRMEPAALALAVMAVVTRVIAALDRRGDQGK
jgi:hypothetical protein